MKRLLSLALMLSMLLALVSCGNNKEAFNVSKEVYNSVNDAYKKVEVMAFDVYEAWRMGINKTDEIGCTASNDSIAKSGLKYFTTHLKIEDKYVISAVYSLAHNSDSIVKYDYSSTSEGIELVYSDWKKLFSIYEDDFAACVSVVTKAYKLSGATDDVEKLLSDARDKMKSLSDKYSDYEHYPNLKEYFTTTRAFFDYCCNPTGSFEQAVTTIEDYKNKAREYYFDLEYVFEDDSSSGDEGENVEEVTTAIPKGGNKGENVEEVTTAIPKGGNKGNKFPSGKLGNGKVSPYESGKITVIVFGYDFGFEFGRESSLIKRQLDCLCDLEKNIASESKEVRIIAVDAMGSEAYNGGEYNGRNILFTYCSFSLANDLGISGYPATFIIDESGIILNTIEGYEPEKTSACFDDYCK